MQSWPYSLGHRTILVRCSVGIDYFVSLGISWASFRAHSWYARIWTCLGFGLSDFKCLYHFVVTVAFQNAGVSPWCTWCDWNESYIGILGRTGLKLQLVLESPLMTPPSEEEGRRERQGFWNLTMFCSVVSVYETHLNAHPLFCKAPVPLMSSPPFLSCPLTDCFLQSLN